MSLEIGQLAPDFTLPATTGDAVTLSDLRGDKVVIMFFPFAFSGLCTSELCELRDDMSSFGDLDAIVVSISCDSKQVLKRFAEEEGLVHLMLSDFWPHGEVARAYGVFVEQVGAAKRGTFIRDRDGRLVWSITTALGEVRDAAEYMRVLEGIA